MGAEQILIELNENNILKIANIIDYCFRWLGWTIIKILASIVNGIEVAINKIYTLNDFFNSDLVTDFINKYKPLIWTILAISIVILGYRIIFNKNKNRENLPSNIIFSVLIVMLLPTFMIKLNEITKLGIEDVKGYSTSANELIKNNLFDLYFLDKNGFQLDKQKNNLKEDKVLNIDINEKIEDSRVITNDIFNKKVTMNDKGENEIVNLDKGWFKLDEQYYRYNIDFIIVIISLGATGITLLCVALKVARLLFELAFNKLFAILFAFADIDDGKKIREIFKNILSIFAVLFATAIMVKLYIIFTTWIGSKMGNVEVGLGFSSENLAKILVQIGASIAVIDGPNIIEKVLGIDAGLRGGFGTVMSAYGVAKGLGLSRKTISSGAKLVGKAAGTSANIGAGMLGGIVGINKGKGSLLQEQNNLKNNSNIKDKNLQNEMNSYKSNSSSNIDNKNNDKENMNTKNKQNNSMINNNENDLSTLKSKNNKISDDFNDNKSLSLGNEIKDNNKSDIMENNNKLNNINGYKGNSLNEQMKNQDNNNSLNSSNSETNKQRESQPKIYDKNSLDYNNRYKGNSLDEEMKNNNNFKQPNKNSDDNMNNLSPLSYGNKKSDELQQEMELKNNKNCYSANEVDKINSNIDEIPNKSICNSNDLKFKNNNEATDLDNQYNVGTILNNYIKGKINSNDQLNSMKRSYNLGKNITSKWDLPKKVNNFKNKKGKENNAI